MGKRLAASSSKNSDSYSHRGTFKPNSSTVCYNCYNKGHLSYDCSLPKAKKPRSSVPLQRNAGYRKRAFEERINQLTLEMEQLKSSLQDDPQLSEKLSETESEDGSTNFINNILLGKSSTAPAFVDLKINGKQLTMECDTGACATICSLQTYNEHFSDEILLPIMKSFYVVSGDKVSVAGTLPVKVHFKDKIIELSLLVIDSKRKFVPLLGRDWLNVIWPHWRKSFSLNSVQPSTESREQWVKNVVSKLKREFSRAFDEDLTEPIKDVVVDIKIDDSAKPFLHKPYTVAFKHKHKVGKYLDDLETKGIISKIEYAEWASPIVVVVKPNKTDIRICMDGSKTVNPHITTHHYPLPLIEELITNKSGAKVFALIDLRGAYQQLVVSESTKKLLVINTHKGLYAFNRLPFGVKPASTLFQCAMDNMAFQMFRLI